MLVDADAAFVGYEGRFGGIVEDVDVQVEVDFGGGIVLRIVEFGVGARLGIVCCKYKAGRGPRGERGR